ncbi:MAG: amino acid ABC transporter permease [Desulfobacterales bacterium]|nr:MAG: amino acid ABC transporter permease [Desulfobacterales bacterium]
MLQKKSKITTLDVFVLLALLGALVYVVYQVKVKLNYNWQWGIIPQYLFRYDAESGKWVSNYLIHGLLTTLRLSFWGTLLATILGTVMGLLRVSKSLFHKMLARSYVELMRNLPPLVIIFIFYFFISDQIMPIIGLDDFLRSSSAGTQRLFETLFSPPQFASAFISALFTLAIFEGAYITEIVRAGIESVEKGQWEASHALGLSKYHSMRHIILPQAMQRLLPALAGQFISLIKDSAIVSVISIQELSYQGTQLMASTYLTIEIWITITALYLVMTLTFSLGVGKLEAYMAKSQA